MVLDLLGTIFISRISTRAASVKSLVETAAPRWWFDKLTMSGPITMVLINEMTLTQTTAHLDGGRFIRQDVLTETGLREVPDG